MVNLEKIAQKAIFFKTESKNKLKRSKNQNTIFYLHANSPL